MKRAFMFYILSRKLCIGLTPLLLCACASSVITRQDVLSQTNSIVFIDTPDARHRALDKYFGQEYAYINERRGAKEAGPLEPAHLLGLSLSGGGIRSAAFQLGLLSGLSTVSSKALAKDKSILSQIDYISSVSGGSWANGMYWSSAAKSDAEFFDCLDFYADQGAPKPGCPAPYHQLRSAQKIAALPMIDMGMYFQRKETWENDIIEAHLGPCNPDLANPLETQPGCPGVGSLRPYPIINSTHSNASQLSTARHFPFQSTPHQIGTVIDRLDADNKPRRGFFISSADEKLTWKHNKFLGFYQPGNKLSLLLAHSSGVLGDLLTPFLLSYSFHLRYDGQRIDELREKYVLADGGKSDNSGVLPLLERSVGTIIMSQIGKESDGNGNDDLGDMQLAFEQSTSLFGCGFRYDLKSAVRDTPVVTTPYTGCNNGREGSIVVVRPTITNVSRFKDALRNSNPQLALDLEEADKDRKRELDDTGMSVCADCFPATPTFMFVYPTPLIRAYYLLGKHIAQNDLHAALDGLKK